MLRLNYTQIIASHEARKILQEAMRRSGFRTVNELLKHVIENAMQSRVNPNGKIEVSRKAF